MKTNTDPFYPDTYHKSDLLQTYVEEQVEKIAEIITDTEKELGGTKSWGYFKSELGDYINEI